MCFFVLVNGTPTGFSSSSRCLGQEDPLSPSLFVIVMEAFSKMISAIVNGGFLLRFSVRSRNVGGLNIFHLLFADDTSIFLQGKPWPLPLFALFVHMF